MPNLRYLPHLLRPRFAAAVGALAILAASIATLALATNVEAKPPAKTVTDVFAVTYDARVTFVHHKAHPEFNAEDNLRYQIHGRLPELTFVDGLLQTDQSAVVKTKVKGSVGSEVHQSDGWSTNCTGTEIKVRGLVGLARVDGGISFLPALSTDPKGRCTDSTGEQSPLFLHVWWPGEGLTGAKTFPLTPKSIDVPKWSKPFRIAFDDEKCPNYEPELTISCTYVIEGKLTLTRVDREEQVNGEVLLPALDPPKLNPQKNKATTTVECQSGCDVEALIGVFGGTAKNPKVTPLHKKQVHLAADQPTTISMPVTAADLAAAKNGLLAMSLRAEGGKEQVYPLMLGGLPDIPGLPDVPGLSARRGPITMAGTVRNLTLPKSATLKGGTVTVPVSNPNGFKARGSLELRLGKRSLGRTTLAVPGHGERKLAVKVDAGGQTALAQQQAARVTAVVSFRDPAGHPRRTTRALTVSQAGAGAPLPGTPKGPTAPVPAPEPPTGPDGTYHGASGLTVVIAAGKVISFNGQITTYCTKSEEQKNVTFGMFGDDPDPQVGADGSFAYEATTGYGVVKLKYEGRVSGSTATGTLVVEDRSPISTSDGRLDFDYCYAGADWSATR